MTARPPEPVRMTCPSCGRFLGIVDGDYFEAPPCNCGWQTTVRRGRVDKAAKPGVALSSTA